MTIVRKPETRTRSWRLRVVGRRSLATVESGGGEVVIELSSSGDEWIGVSLIAALAEAILLSFFSGVDHELDLQRC